MSRKRILYVEQNTDGTVGGSYYSLLGIVRRLDRDKYEPMVVFYQDNILADEFRRRCPTFIIPPPSPIDLKARSNGSASFISRAAELLQMGINFFKCNLPSLVRKAVFLMKNDIDLVHLNNSAACGYDWLAVCLVTGRRCITHNRGMVSISRPGRFFLKRFDAVISISGFLVDNIRSQGVRDVRLSVVINNGIDTEEMVSRVKRSREETRNNLSVDPAQPLIGVVGNIKRWKGQDIVVSAVDLLRKEYPGLHCLIIGDISKSREDDHVYYQSIRSFVNEKGLQNTVRFLGYRDDVPEIVNSLDILVHASTIPEPFGRVILEGMALGRPVIATDFGGPAEIIENGVSGILVPAGDASALAGEIGLLLKDGERRDRIAETGRRSVAERFPLDKCVEKIEDLYDRLLV